MRPTFLATKNHDGAHQSSLGASHRQSDSAKGLRIGARLGARVLRHTLGQYGAQKCHVACAHNPK